METPFSELRMRYSAWWYAVNELTDGVDLEGGQDFEDFVDAFKTLLTFGPNPQSFNPPITPEDIFKWRSTGGFGDLFPRN